MLERRVATGAGGRRGPLARPLPRAVRVPLDVAREALLMVGLYGLYKFARFLIRGHSGTAFSNARAVIRFERLWGITNEAHLQELILDKPTLARFFNQYYVLAHFTVISVFLLWLVVLHHEGYRRVRRVLVLVTAMGLLVHIAFPLAPPRMFPDMGWVDTGRVFGPAGYGEHGVFDGVANQFAAMPSLHFGWSVLVAWGVWKYARRLRWVGGVHAGLTLSTIVLTANHYWMDSIVASVLLVLAFAIDARFFPPSPFHHDALEVTDLTDSRTLALDRATARAASSGARRTSA